ncbi:MAG: glycosyltransferase involved in cell wall biosynthesis [Gammaproteobacteria bacterium]|jgi:glycosyltransferase involved in cell wall biosynthesis
MVAKAPRFSVLLPTHNRADVVGTAISSILRQTNADFELLVVGDGCTDKTADVVTSFGDERIRWFDLPKAPGFGYANRNIALKEARGDLIAFAAHDDLLLPDHLERMGKLFEQPECHFAYSRPLWIDDAGRVFPFFVNLQSLRQMRRFLNVRNILPATTVVHRRSCFDDVGYWSEDLDKAADWDMWVRIIRKTGPARAGFCRVPTTLHFRANWRAVDRWGPAPLNYMEGVADARGKWPDGLCFDASNKNGTLQGHVLEQFNELRSRQLRRAVVELQDEFSWESSFPLSFERG